MRQRLVQTLRSTELADTEEAQVVGLEGDDMVVEAVALVWAPVSEVVLPG